MFHHIALLSLTQGCPIYSCPLIISDECTGKPHQNDRPNLGPERHQGKGDQPEDTLRLNRMGEVGQEWASVESSIGLAGGHVAQGQVQGGDVRKGREREREGESSYMERSPFGWLIGGAAVTTHTPDRAAAVERDAGEEQSRE